VQRSFQFTNFLLFKRSLVDNIPEEGNKLNGKLMLSQTSDSHAFDFSTTSGLEFA